MFWRPEPVMPNVYCFRDSCTITFLGHIWHRSFTLLSRHGSFALAYCKDFYILHLLHFVAWVELHFEAYLRGQWMKGIQVW